MAFLILLFLALSYSDFLYTTFMLRKYGIGIELNPVIRWLAKPLGLDLGVLVGIALPTLVLLVAGIHFRPLLEGVFLARLMLFFLQARNLRTELCILQKPIKFN